MKTGSYQHWCVKTQRFRSYTAVACSYCMGTGIDITKEDYEREGQVEAPEAVSEITSLGESEASDLPGQETEEEKH